MVIAMKVGPKEIEIVQEFCRNNNLNMDEISSKFMLKFDEKVIGYCEYIMDEILDNAMITECFIFPKYRESKFGELLVSAVLNSLELNKIYNVYVSFSNDRVENFYKRLRFKEVNSKITDFDIYYKKYIYYVNLNGYFDSPCKNCKK